ncbi:MAG: AmmeMemoRadiSam system protein B [Anaerolineae bacterium]
MNPKLREIEIHPIQHQGQEMLLLRDPLHLSDKQIAVPRPLGLLLALMDGTRDSDALEAALRVRAGVRLAAGLLEKLLEDMDAALLLENERFQEARSAALRSYRQAPYRPLSLDVGGLSPTPELARVELQGYLDALPSPDSLGVPSVRGLISPHIDYQRGGAVYAEVWRAATKAACEAELVIMLGTDHQGSAGTLTLTEQSYATPWGVLPTDLGIVRALAAELGEEASFAEELHHRGEHSIELAASWLHFVRGGEPVPMVPILCGHFGAFVEGHADPAEHEPFAVAVRALREVMDSRRALVVAAADLAHVGPAFGDSYGLDFIGKARLRSADERLLEAIYAGDDRAFFELLRAEGDRRHVCGLPPIYLTLRLLGDVRGRPAGYALCPADTRGTSAVTIAGVTLH